MDTHPTQNPIELKRWLAAAFGGPNSWKRNLSRSLGTGGSFRGSPGVPVWGKGVRHEKEIRRRAGQPETPNTALHARLELSRAAHHAARAITHPPAKRQYGGTRFLDAETPVR